MLLILQRLGLPTEIVMRNFCINCGPNLDNLPSDPFEIVARYVRVFENVYPNSDAIGHIRAVLAATIRALYPWEAIRKALPKRTPGRPPNTLKARHKAERQALHAKHQAEWADLTARQTAELTAK